jgi:hypothetical protein
MASYKSDSDYLKNNPKGYWFKRKLYGWGWYPCSWQGWLTILVWAILFSFAMLKMDYEWLKNLIFIFIMTAVLLWICYRKGETPRWSWGR